MTNISASQRAGESTFRGLDYQKKFIAYLCTEMLSGKLSIKRITCEQLDYIEVEEDSQVVYYQIKSTSKDSLDKSEVTSSIKLFSSINDSAIGKSKYHKYVLVSNARILKFRDSMRRHPFNQLDDKIKNEIKLLKIVRTRSNLLQNIYLMRGPSLQDISSTIITSLVRALMHGNGRYDFFKIKNDLLSYINHMCPGPTDLEDMKIIDDKEGEDYTLKHKTITMQIVHEIIDKSVRAPQETVYRKTTIKHKLHTTQPDNEQLQEIHELIDEYNSFPEDDEKRYTYLLKFKDKSSRFKLYNDRKFLQFLKQILLNSINKYFILECLFILHNLITASKAESDK